MGPFATLNNWLVDVFNLLSGNLDREGGCLFPQPAVDLADFGEQRQSTGRMDTGRTRVRGAPSYFAYETITYGPLVGMTFAF